MGVTPEFVQGELARAKEYTVAFLKDGPNWNHEDRDGLVGAHAMRNFELRAEGKLAIVGPMRSDGDIRGLYIFNLPPHDVAPILESDPAVEAGIFVYEMQTMMAFPGDALG